MTTQFEMRMHKWGFVPMGSQPLQHPTTIGFFHGKTVFWRHEATKIDIKQECRPTSTTWFTKTPHGWQWHHNLRSIREWIQHVESRMRHKPQSVYLFPHT